MDDAITIYPLNDLCIKRIDAFLEEQTRRYMHSEPALGISGYIHQNDADHGNYHKDDFDDKSDHYHLRFSTPLDEKKIEEFLTVLVESRLLTKVERELFMTAYRSANSMSVAPEKIPTAIPGPEVVGAGCCLFSFFRGGAASRVAPSPAVIVALR